MPEPPVDAPQIIPGCSAPRTAPGPDCNDTHWAAHTAAAITTKSLALVDQARAVGAPWYINAWFHVSHAMLVPTAEQLAAYPYTSACRLGALNSNQTTCAHQVFWAAQHAADSEMGRLLDGLRERNLWTNTVIAFSADNGPEEPMVFTNAVGTTGPFRGRKRSLYDGGVRLPFVIAHPGVGRKGAVEHTPVNAVDWLPTVLSLAGIRMPATMVATQRGQDISGLILANATADDTSLRTSGRDPDKPMFWEWRYAVAGPCWNEAPGLATRAGRYKLLVNHPGQRERAELYDFGEVNASGSMDSIAALYESQNLAGALPDVVERLKQPLLSWHASLPPGPVLAHEGCGGFGWPGAEAVQKNQGPSQEPSQRWAVIEDDPAHVL